MIQLNGVDWRLAFVNPRNPNLFRNDGSLTVGMCDGDRRIIYLNEFLNGAKLWDVLLHELTHASLFSYGYNLDKVCHEELIADFVAKHGAEIVDIGRKIYNDITKGEIE